MLATFACKTRGGKTVASKKTAEFVSNARVVNDLAERAIKRICNFAGTITRDEHRQFLLQVN